MASSVKYLSDLPDPAKEISKCNEFLSSFRDEYGELKYMNMLVRQSICTARAHFMLLYSIHNDCSNKWPIEAYKLSKSISAMF